MAPPNEQDDASPAQIEALADQLSASADALHARILAELKAHGEGRAGERELAMARALFDQELVLRQHAQALYLNAATLIAGALGDERQRVAALTVAAAEKIRKIAVIGDAVSVVAGLVQLAAAAATGQPATIVVAIEKLSKKVKLLDAHGKKPA